MPDVFQWLYDCVSLKKKSSKVFVFVMQFVPDLVLLYLLCTSENIQKVNSVSLLSIASFILFYL